MERSNCTIVAVAGGSGSGKTTFARTLQRTLGKGVASVLSQDSYYIDQSARFKEDGGEVNFDEPASLDFPLLKIHLEDLKRGNPIEVPIYDFASHKRLSGCQRLLPMPVVIVDGTLILSQDLIRPFFDFSVFLDASETVRFERRFRRDVRERSRQPEGVKRQFLSQVKPMHDLYVQPSSLNARWMAQDDRTIDLCMKELLAELSTRLPEVTPKV